MMKPINFYPYALVLIGSIALADGEGMPGMPMIKPTKSYTVQTRDQGETLQEDRGFGDKEAEIGMMNLMMVGGSGYEGMDMGEMKMADMKSSPHSGHTMSMPPEQATKPDVMKTGMDHSAHLAMNDKKNAPESSVDIELTQSPEKPKVGANIYEFVVKDKNGKTLAGLKPTAEVSMTSMDMGTETPKVKEPSPGHYKVKAIFSMQGPWALKIKTKQNEKTFNFEASK